MMDAGGIREVGQGDGIDRDVNGHIDSGDRKESTVAATPQKPSILASGCLSLDDLPEELREELRKIQVGHNLASVMNDPSDGAGNDSSGLGSWLGFGLGSGPGASSGIASLLFDRDEVESTSVPVPALVAPVELRDFDSYLGRNGSVVRRFVRNHQQRLFQRSHVESQTRKLNLVRRGTSAVDNSTRSGPGSKASESVRRQEFLEKGLQDAVQNSGIVRRRGSTSSVASVEEDAIAENPPVSPSRAERAAIEVARRKKKLSNDALKVCLQKVPAKFFEKDYTVEFDQGQPNSSSDSRNRNSDSSSAAYLVQEQLSNWLDLVEVTLWSQTTSQAQEFFSALSDLHELNAYVKDTCDTVTKLRSHVKAVQQSIVANHLAVLQQRRRQRNVKSLEALLAKVGEVRATIPRVDQLLANGSEDYAGALMLLADARQELCSELAGIHSLRTLSRQLDDYESMIVNQLNDKFVNICATWDGQDSIHEEEEESDDEEAKEQGKKGLDAEAERADAAQTRDQALASSLLPLVAGLLNARSVPLRDVLSQYRTRIIAEVKTAAKSSVVEALAALQAAEEDPESGDAVADKTANPAPLSSAAQLAALSQSSFLSFLSLVFDSLQMVMERAHSVHNAFIICLNRAKERSRSESADSTKNSSETEGLAVSAKLLEALSAESMEVLSRVCELSQNSMQKLLMRRLKEIEKAQAARESAFLKKRVAFENIRAKLDEQAKEAETSKIRALQEKLLASQPTLYDFKQLYDRVGSFSLRAEKLSSPATSIDLKGALRLAAKNFVAQMHEAAMSRLRTTIDADQWRGEACPRTTQAAVNRMISGRLSAARTLPGQTLPSKGARDLMIAGKPFRIVSTLPPMLEDVEKYLAAAQQLSLAPTALPALLDLLRLFNERTNSLVLRAEAIRTANLKGKKIIPKNLALASQALSAVQALLPPMESVLVGCLPRQSRHFEKDKTQVELQLAQLSGELGAHREKIFNKFVEMIEEVLNVCCGAQMRQVDWDARTPSDIKPEAYMIELTQRIKGLHASLLKFLPADHLQEVFVKIFDMFNRRVPELYEAAQPKTGVGVSQVRVDLRNLAHCLRLLPGTSGLGDGIDQLANEKFASLSNATKGINGGTTPPLASNTPSPPENSNN